MLTGVDKAPSNKFLLLTLFRNHRSLVNLGHMNGEQDGDAAVTTMKVARDTLLSGIQEWGHFHVRTCAIMLEQAAMALLELDL